MARPQTFVEHDILTLDASRGIRYASFEDFWTRRMAPMQFIPANAGGALGAVRDTMKERAREQFQLWCTSAPADGCGGSPQAGGLPISSPHGAGGAQLWGQPRKEFTLEGTGFTLKDCGCRGEVCEQLKDGTCHA